MGAVSDDQTLARITAEPLSVDEALAFVADPSSGGSCIFVGTVRDADANGRLAHAPAEVVQEVPDQVGDVLAALA